MCLKCFECGAFQGSEKKKSAKFACLICHAKQSVRKVYATSELAKDIRLTVQRLNMQRGEHDLQQQQTHVHNEQDERDQHAHGSDGFSNYDDDDAYAFNDDDHAYNDNRGSKFSRGNGEERAPENRWSAYADEDANGERVDDGEGADPRFVLALPKPPPKGRKRRSSDSEKSNARPEALQHVSSTRAPVFAFELKRRKLDTQARSPSAPRASSSSPSSALTTSVAVP
jgi:hypothetical protein